MPRFDDKFGDRLNSQANAKKALLDKFRAKTAEDATGRDERQAVRRELIAAREARAEERARLKAEDEARRAAEEAARQEALRLEQEARERDALEAAEAAAKLEAERKALRDARYAARKERGKKGKKR